MYAMTDIGTCVERWLVSQMIQPHRCTTFECEISRTRIFFSKKSRSYDTSEMMSRMESKTWLRGGGEDFGKNQILKYKDLESKYRKSFLNNMTDYGKCAYSASAD